MKIQYLNGGLANQVFQYIFVRFAEITYPDSGPWFFDDSFFYVKSIHNGYELEKVFGLKLNLLSRSFDKEVWEELIQSKKKEISIPQSFKNMGFPIIMLTEFENYKEHNPFGGDVFKVPGNVFIPEIADIKVEYVYYHGYWMHRAWFDACKQIVGQELVFPPIMDEKNLIYRDLILTSKSVAIHIRRGDYVKIGWSSSDNYYKSAVSEMLSIEPDAVLFVFSDDIGWCKKNGEKMGLNLSGKTIYVEGNVNGNNYLDLQLMSMCEYMIIGKSAFSYLAMLLNDRLKHYISDYR